MTLDDLTSYGADTADGLARCMGMEAFYLQLVESIKGETNVETLRSALAEGRLDDAFAAAHALKGIFANLALTPLLTPVSEMTEFLRARTDMDYAPLMAQIDDAWTRFLAL